MGTGDWVTDQRPKSWREQLLYLYVNGTLPLNGILAKMPSESTNDPEFYWWTKTFPDQAGDITGIYTDSGLSTAYVSGGVAGDIVYVKMSAAHLGHFRIGHQVLLKDADDPTVDVNGKVISRTSNGASSNVGVKLLEADDNSSYSHDLSNADRIIVIGNINAEGAAMPTGVQYDPDKYYNLTQIFRTPLSITRTARRTKLRTGAQYQEAKREALELHGIEMERAFIFGIKTEGTGDNGKPERTTQGILPFIREYNSTCVSDFTLNATYHGKKWVDDGGGKTFLDYYLELLFRYGRNERLAICGSGALIGISNLVIANTHYSITEQTTSYGIKVTEWRTPVGRIYLKDHPLFNIEPALRYSMLILDPQNLKYRYVDDTQFYGEGEAKQAAPGTNGGRIDGTQEEYLTECGLEIHHPYTTGFLSGIGQDHDS